MMNEETIVKFLAGEAEPHEAVLLMKWREENPENEKQFRQLEKLWTGSEGLRNKVIFNTDQAWDKVNSRTQQKSADGLTYTRKKWMIAASFALLLSVSVYFYSLNKPEKEIAMMSLSSADSTLKLDDGSQIRILGATIEYPEKFGQSRNMKMKKGKAFFSVIHDEKRTFEIEVENTLVTVLGTEFEISDEHGIIRVSVMGGKVRFRSPGGDVILTSGQTASFNKSSNQISGVSPSEPNNFSYISGRMIFSEDRLDKVVEILNQYYGTGSVRISESLKSCRISATFEKDSLSDVLEVIEATIGAKIIRNESENYYLLEGEACNP